MKWLIFGIALLTCNCAMWCQGFVFPNSDELLQASRSKSENRTEWTISAMQNGTCPKNMQLYSAYNNASITICDCRPKFLYFPSNDTCYEAYKQGPCPPHYYVVLPKGEVIPRCEKNPCLEDSVVRYNNTCYALRSIGAPCGGILEVNETTFEIECVKTDVESHTIVNVPKRPCPAGSRRCKLGMCVKIH